MSNYYFDEIVENSKLVTKGIGSKKYCKEFYEQIGNLQKKRIYMYGASSKVGKTTVCDYLHILVPYIEGYRKLKYYYFGWEINLSDKMAAFCSFFMSFKYNLILDTDTILGIKRDLTEDELEKIKDIYNNEITELFGTYDEDGVLIEEGIICYIEERMTPEEFEEKLRDIGKIHGHFVEKKGQEKYLWKNIVQHVWIIIDHLGKTKKGRLMQKDAIDKITDSCVVYRNLCHFSFVIISQFNRGLTAIDRRGLMNSSIRPEKTDFKDSSNGAEDCNYLFAMFNPLLIAELDDIKINNKTYKLRKSDKIIEDMGFRGLYLLEARNCLPFEFAFQLKTNYIEIRK